jgi:uncharacterized protein (UPF0147 family)
VNSESTKDLFKIKKIILEKKFYLLIAYLLHTLLLVKFFMPRAPTDEEKQAFENVEYLLNGMMQDRSVPRNIKRIAQRGINELHREDDTPGVLASNVMYMVDDLSQDPNIPFHARTTIYRIISVLEKVKD